MQNIKVNKRLQSIKSINKCHPYFQIWSMSNSELNEDSNLIYNTLKNI